MIAHFAVRMALKNRVIVDVLRDRLDFDPQRVASIARQQLEELAEQETLTAERLRSERDRGSGKPQDLLDGTRHDPQRADKARRARIVESLGTSLWADIADEDVVARLVEQARQDAWDEIQSSVRRRAALGVPAERDPGYETQRADRIATLVALDLAGLAAEHNYLLEGPG